MLYFVLFQKRTFFYRKRLCLQWRAFSLIHENTILCCFKRRQAVAFQSHAKKNNRSKHKIFLTKIFKRIEFVFERSQHYIFPQRSSVRNIFFSESMFIYIYIYIIRRRTTTMDGRTMTTTTDGRTDGRRRRRTDVGLEREANGLGDRPDDTCRGVPCRGPPQRPRLGDTLRYPSVGWRH